MLQKLGDHITNCLARADNADRQASAASDLHVKAENKRMAIAWRHLASSYEFIESLERFLLDGHAAKNGHLSPPLHCPTCCHDMHLLGIEGGDTGQLFTFECADCGNLEVMGTQAAQ